MRFEITTVTPEVAAKLLGKNENNRKLREPRAALLAQAMTEGKWRLTHQAVAISPRGRLLDGQHRLRAVALSGKTVQMVIAYDVPDTTFGVIDAGMPRKMYERLKSDPRNTTIATQMLRLMLGSKTSQEYEVQTMLDVAGDAMLKVAQVAGPNKRRGGRMSKATQEAAVVLRMADAIRSKDEDAQIRINWKLEKLRRGDMAGAPPIIVAYNKQLTDGVHSGDALVSPQVDEFCRAWRAFDPEKESVPRLHIDDHGAIVREARDLFQEISEGVFL